MQIVHNQFYLHPKSITVLVWGQNFVVKGCFFYNTVIFSIFCISKLFKLQGGTERRLAFCVCLYLGHDLLYPQEEKVIFVKHFFFLLLLLYVEWSHFLPSNDQKISVPKMDILGEKYLSYRYPNAPPSVFFTFFKLSKWYTNSAKHHILRYWQYS